MPGKCNKDFNIEIENRILNISTLNDNQTSEYNYNIQEFNYTSFNKSYDLPESIDLEKVDSLYRNGIYCQEIVAPISLPIFITSQTSLPS